ncbi:MAG TPA: hypothetical protein VFE50_26670, partial [Cyclobacteriaceae bacterium]|nr:hypothetical protein [Cyclobacteriaceae bacterium]
FANAMSVVDVPIKHTHIYPFNNFGPVFLEDNSIAAGFSFGAGVALRRISIEARYYTQRTRQADELPLKYYYGKTSIIFGFRLF